MVGTQKEFTQDNAVKWKMCKDPVFWGRAAYLFFLFENPLSLGMCLYSEPRL